MIVKDKQERAKKEASKYRWAICADGSEKSFKAFSLIGRAMDKTKDELLGLTVETTKISMKDVESQVGEHIKKEGVLI